MIEDGWERRRGAWQVGDRVLLRTHKGYQPMTVVLLGTREQSRRVDGLFEGKEARYAGQSEAEFGLAHFLRCDDEACACHLDEPNPNLPADAYPGQLWRHTANECQLVPYVAPAVTEYGMPVDEGALF